MAVTSIDCQLKLSVTETPESTNTASGQSVVHAALNQSYPLGPATTQPVNDVAGRSDFALSGGAASVDFTAIRGTGGANRDFTGKKVQAILLKNKSTNTGDMTFSVGASNGLELFGASFTFKLKPGQCCLFYLHDAAPDVASGDRTIDVAGTGTEQFEIIAVAG